MKYDQTPDEDSVIVELKSEWGVDASDFPHDTTFHIDTDSGNLYYQDNDSEELEYHLVTYEMAAKNRLMPAMTATEDNFNQVLELRYWIGKYLNDGNRSDKYSDDFTDEITFIEEQLLFSGKKLYWSQI